MGVLSFFRQVYDLDTIDTRFTATSTKPDARNDPGASKDRAAKWNSKSASLTSSPSRWMTPDSMLNFLVVGVAIPLMCYTGYDASKSRVLRSGTDFRYDRPG